MGIIVLPGPQLANMECVVPTDPNVHAIALAAVKGFAKKMQKGNVAASAFTRVGQHPFFNDLGE